MVLSCEVVIGIDVVVGEYFVVVESDEVFVVEIVCLLFDCCLVG